jgi:hypothetical protein
VIRVSVAEQRRQKYTAPTGKNGRKSTAPAGNRQQNKKTTPKEETKSWHTGWNKTTK